MDGKDLNLVETLIDEIKKIDEPATVLLNTPTTQIAKTNFFLLKGLLGLEDMKGYYVTFDRPHQNMAYLLKNHDISQKNIWYIDTLTQVSKKKRIDRENVDFVDSPFEIEKLTDIFRKEQGKRNDFGSLEKIDFILIDNLSAMASYNSIEKIKKFITSFEELIYDHESLLGYLIMDSDAQAELAKFINKNVSNVIDVKKLKEDL